MYIHTLYNCNAFFCRQVNEGTEDIILVTLTTVFSCHAWYVCVSVWLFCALYAFFTTVAGEDPHFQAGGQVWSLPSLGESLGACLPEKGFGIRLSGILLAIRQFLTMY